MSFSFTYKDLNLQTLPSLSSQNPDLPSFFDIEAIKQSIKTLFTTSPGEKLLDPSYGSQIKKYLFEPLSEVIAYNIGKHIKEILQKFEPRIRVQEVTIILLEEEQAYQVILSFQFPNLSETQKIDLRLGLHSDNIS